MTCINSMAEELRAHELVKHDLIHEERLFSVILDLTENGFLEELLVQCYLAKTEEEILEAHKKLVEIVEDSLTRVATRRSF